MNVSEDPYALRFLACLRNKRIGLDGHVGKRPVVNPVVDACHRKPYASTTGINTWAGETRPGHEGILGSAQRRGPFVARE